jgi:inosine-uridine nucleoside N-ribohydrolase
LQKILPYSFRSYRLELGYENIWLHDAVAYVAALEPDLFELELSAGDVELSGELTTGATVFDRRRVREWRTNLAVTTKVDIPSVRQFVLGRLAAAGEASQDRR